MWFAINVPRQYDDDCNIVRRNADEKIKQKPRTKRKAKGRRKIGTFIFSSPDKRCRDTRAIILHKTRLCEKGYLHARGRRSAIFRSLHGRTIYIYTAAVYGKRYYYEIGSSSSSSSSSFNAYTQ